MSQDSTRPDFGEAFKAIRQGFIRRLPKYLSAINQDWTAWQQEPKPKTALRRLHETAHKLSGSGSTFGFPEISQAAQPLEVILEGVVETEEALTPEQAGRLAQTVNALVDTLKSVANSSPVVETEEKVSRKLRVGIAGADEFEAMCIESMISESGHHPRILSAEAAGIPTDSPIDALLLDLTTCESTEKALEKLKLWRNCNQDELCIIAIIDPEQEASLAEILDNGAAACLTPPVDPADLQAVLSQISV